MRIPGCEPQVASAQPKVMVLPALNISMQKINMFINPSKQWLSKTPAVWLDMRHSWPHTNQVILFDTTYPPWTSPCQKSKILTDSFQRYWWSKNLAISLDKRHNWPYPTKKVAVSDATCLDDYLFPKHEDINWLQYFQRYRWSENPTIWLPERHN